jgi:hypothetical protein
MLRNAKLFMMLSGFDNAPLTCLVSGDVEISEDGEMFYGNGNIVGIECTIEGVIKENTIEVGIVVSPRAHNDYRTWIFYGLSFVVELVKLESPSIGLVGKWKLAGDGLEIHSFNTSGSALGALCVSLEQTKTIRVKEE